jgi:hypothetical protein
MISAPLESIMQACGGCQCSVTALRGNQRAEMASMDRRQIATVFRGFPPNLMGVIRVTDGSSSATPECKETTPARQSQNRGLHVTQKTSMGFAVRESQDGRSTIAFSYRIVAKPLNNQEPRLPFLIPRKPRILAPQTESRFAIPMPQQPKLVHVRKERPIIPIFP